MTIARSDLKFVKSKTVTDTGSNGGRMSYIDVLNRTKYNLFPRVTKPERISGITRYRKEFIWNANSSDEQAFGVLAYLTLPSLANDFFNIALGTQIDTQADVIASSDYEWFGSGSLAADVGSSDTSISINFEDDSVDLKNNVLLAITNHFLQDQDVTSTVKVLDQVYWNGSSWVSQSAGTVETQDIHPYGTCIELLGNNKATIFSYTDEGFLEYHYVDSTESNVTMSPFPDGVEVDFAATCENLPVEPKTAKIIYTIGSTEYEVTDDGLGEFSGVHLTSGTINYGSGVINITFNEAPMGALVYVLYQESKVSWSGNTATVTLADGMLNDYLIADSNTFIGMCLPVGDLIPTASATWSLQTGDFDVTKVSLTNKGTIEQSWSLLFQDATSYICTGDEEGSLGLGYITGTFAPNNPDQGSPFISIPVECWAGVNPTAGDLVTIHTVPSSASIWWKEEVPELTDAYSNNLTLLELYVE